MAIKAKKGTADRQLFAKPNPVFLCYLPTQMGFYESFYLVKVVKRKALM
jgi:hypothetical protein